MGKSLVPFMLICPTLILFWVWKALCWIWLKPMKLEKYLREKGIGGSGYKLVLGDLKEQVRLRKEAQSRPMEHSHSIVPRVLPFHNQIMERYGREGKMFATWFGPTLTLIIMDPDFIKEIFFNKDHHFVQIKSSPFSVLITGLATYEGEKWAKHRKILNPAFHQDKLKTMSPALYISCSNLVSNWQTMVSAGSCEIDVRPDLQILSKDVISRTAFGSSYKEGHRIFQLTDELFALALLGVGSVYIPGLKFFPSKRNNRVKKVTREMQDLLKDMIDKRRESMNYEEEPTSDVLGLLMESNVKELDENARIKNAGLSINDHDIIEECRLFYFGGQEPASSLLVWTMVVLSMHRNWQEKARAEVMEVFGRTKPDFEGLSRLKIVTMILNEVLRLYPPVPFAARAIDKEVKLGDVCLPVGVQVVLPILLIHHSHEIWGEDAHEFKPERFSRGISEATKNRFVFFPFGWGQRICIGQNLVLTEAKMALSMILQNLSSSYHLTMSMPLSVF